MAQISFIDDAYIDDIIKAVDPYNPALNRTQGVKMRELIKQLRDYIKTSNSQFTAEYDALLARVVALENSTPKYTPEPPTNGLVNDSLDFFSFTQSPMASGKEQYEYTTDGGATIISPIYAVSEVKVDDVNIPAGDLKVRVKGSENRNPSAWLSSSQPFTKK